MWQSGSFWLGQAGLIAALYALHRLALWLERRDWLIYTREQRRQRGSLLVALAAAVDPSVRHLIEVQEREDLEEAESGDDSEPPPGPYAG